MISSKSEKSSRRSSILKLPKPRQPFQSVEANGSTIEDTPMKQKRRVSFAEKKHVKEFCDSMEQGTVWDNTYEESELSHTKNTLLTNTDDNAHIQVLSEISNAINYQSSSQETSVVVHHQSRKVLIRQNAIDLDHLPIEAIRSRLEPGDIDHVIMSANPELLANKENIPAVLKLSVVESSLIEDDELIFGQKNQQKSTSQSFSVYCDDNMEDENEDNVLNKTDHQDVSMDCTLPATDSILSSNIDNAVNMRQDISNFAGTTDRTRVFHEDNTMEMTNAVSSALRPRLNEVQNGTILFHNKSMETTEVMPSLCSSVPHSNIRMNETMEFTQAVLPSSRILTQQRMVDDATQVFHNKSMEMTEIVPSKCPQRFCEERTQVFHNKSMEMTEIVPSKCPQRFCEERTQVFHDKSMEMTQMVPSKCPERFCEERTQVFHNKSMEMTEIVPPKCPQRFCEERTQVFHDKSMEMTEVVPSKCPEQFCEERTQVFHNKSMEMTEVVPSKCPEQFCEDRTQLFHNKSMEMTAAMPSVRPVEFPGDKTRIFQNTSMEMTEAVPTEYNSIRLSQIPQNNIGGPDRSMELTEAVSSIRPRQFLGNRTQIFHNHSMEMTEAVPAIPITYPSGQLPRETTDVFNNESMEFTEVVSSIRPREIPGDKTRIFLNNSMEMTEAVPIMPHSRHPLPIAEDKTQLFYNKSMEITEAINPNHFSSTSIQQDKPHLTKSILNTSNRTQIFTNYCMEHTEVIPSLKRQYQQISENKTLDYEITSPNAKNLRNNSIHRDRRVSEADQAALHRLLHRNLDESLEKSIPQSSPLPNCHNQSMEMTAAIPAHFGRAHLHQHNSQMLNESMEMTEVIPSFSNNVNPTNDIPEDSSFHPESEKFSGDNRSTHASLIKTPPPNVGIPDGDMDDSIEQLRYRASSVSKLCHEDITYNFTAPITSKNVNIDMTNVLEDIEEPSFVYANISGDVSATDMEKEVEDIEPMPLPEISITEDISQFDNRRKTYVMSRDAREGCVSSCEEMNESLICGTDDLRRSGIKIVDDIPVSNTENVTTSPEIYSRDNKTAHTERSCITGARRRTYIVDKNEEDAMAGKRKIIRSDRRTYLITPTVNEALTKTNSDQIETSVSDASSPCSPPAKIIEPVTQSKTVAKVIISPVKKINLEFEALVENDLIVARIEKQQRITAAMASEKNVVKAGENRLELESPVVSMNSITAENKSRYDILVDQLNEIANKHDTIWRIESMSQRVIRIEYCMTALLLKIVFNVPDHPNELEKIDRVQIVSQMSEKEKAILQTTDRLIVQKINVESLKNTYKTYDDVLNLIEYVTNEANSVFDFYHELKRLSRINTMTVTVDKVSFRVWTKRMIIILDISMNIKPLVDIQPEDIDVTCLLGSIRVNDVKNLIRNIKRNHKFLTFYINDIKNYIELMEESTATCK